MIKNATQSSKQTRRASAATQVSCYPLPAVENAPLQRLQHTHTTLDPSTPLHFEGSSIRQQKRISSTSSSSSRRLTEISADRAVGIIVTPGAFLPPPSIYRPGFSLLPPYNTLPLVHAINISCLLDRHPSIPGSSKHGLPYTPH